MLFYWNLPKSMNCFIDNGEGENLEKRSTCFGIFDFALFSKSCANFILIPRYFNFQITLNVVTDVCRRNEFFFEEKRKDTI